MKLSWSSSKSNFSSKLWNFSDFQNLKKHDCVALLFFIMKDIWSKIIFKNVWKKYINKITHTKHLKIVRFKTNQQLKYEMILF